MAGTAGKDAIVKTHTSFHTDTTGYATVGEVQSVTDEEGIDLFDVSAIGETDWRKRMQGLGDATVTMTVVRDASDTGQDNIRASMDSGQIVYVAILYDGTNGYQWPMFLESRSHDVSRDGALTESYTLRFSAVVGTLVAPDAVGTP